MFRNQKVIASLAVAIVSVFATPIRAQTPERNLRVAIYDFDQKAGGNVPTDLGKRVALLVTSKLVSGGAHIDIISRDQIQRILKEQNLQFSDIFDATGAVQIGKLLTADAIVTGSVEGEVSSRSLGVGPLKRITFKASMGGTAQLVSISTARVLIAPSTRQSGEVTENFQYKTTTTGNGGAGAQAIDIAADKVGAELASQIAARLSEIPRPASVPTADAKQQPTPPAPQPVPVSQAPENTSTYTPLAGEVGPVIRVKSNQVTISLAQGGHRAGEVLQVKHVEMVADPRTGKQLPIGETIGTLTLTDVAADYATGKFVGGHPPNVGDRAVGKAPPKNQ